jgi:hypothetical protein
MEKKITMRRVAAGLACLSLAAVAASPTFAAPAKGSKLSVTPATGSTGTKFTITFLTPAAAPRGAYRVHAQAAVGAAPSSGCSGTFDFSNPKTVMANQHVSFAFRVTADEQLCTGRWTVTVKRARRSQAPSAHFTLR